MAVDMFLKLGDVKGEAPDSVHKDTIEVLNWSFGCTQSGTAHVAGGAGAGRVEVQDLTVTKYVDRSSPQLFSWCCSGTHIPTATLIVRKAGGKQLEYLKVTMQDIIVTSCRTGGSPGDDRISESITLNFAKFKLEYVPQQKDGSGMPSITKGWDIAGNTNWD